MEFKVIEKKWQKWWGQHPELYRADDKSSKPKKYILNEFPYPSGSGLHVGHAFSFTGGDVFARFKRMQGSNVLFPMGWDAFGLPTENFAIKMKKKPQQVTKENTDMFRSQMDQLAFSYDWSREVNTTDPKYYKWTQWIFVKLFEAGLAYKKEMPINWCPSCKIGLANEEVVDNKCERCGAEVSRRNISQWVVKITEYADRLIDGLKDTNFIDKVKMAQINWIGRKEGVIINHKVEGLDINIETFSAYPAWLFADTFIVVAPEHPIVKELVNGTDKETEVNEFISETRKISNEDRVGDKFEKKGCFTGRYAHDPFNPGRMMPIWLANFALLDFGTGMIRCSAHDVRDYEFAIKYGIEMQEVVDRVEKDIPVNAHGNTGILKNSGKFTGRTIDKELIREIVEWIVTSNIGKREVTYHLRDWIFSRQHYWGEPIPMVYCENCARHGGQGWVPEKPENLPIVLPEVEAYEPTDDGLSPLSRIPEFVNCTCPKCGSDAKRETDTMPNWAGSDWYFLRYCDPHNDIYLASHELSKKWLPVDIYIGGDEHNTLHLLYSRFIHQFLYDIKAVTVPEPYDVRMSHGVILGPDNARMSKSKGNVIVPEVVADKYGVDVVRMYLMFMGPFDGTMAWNENTLMGVKRFLDRFMNYVDKTINNYQLTITNDSSDDIKVIINKLIYSITRDLEVFGYNTVVAKLMKGLNDLEAKNISKEDTETFIKLIAPMAPYIAEELWSRLGHADSIHQTLWPVVDEKYLVEDKIIIPVAINGKMRDQVIKSKDTQDVIKMAKELESIQKWLLGKTIIKEIYIEDKMVNFVIKG